MSQRTCPTEGCGKPGSYGRENQCSACYQRARRAARGVVTNPRGAYQSNAGKLCKVEWCDKPAASIGWCQACYTWSRTHDGADPVARRYRYNRTGADVLAMALAIEPDPVTGCRIATGTFSQNRQGYPSTSVGGRLQTITRVVLAEVLGRPMRPRTVACHTCDTPACVSPDHLWEGTHQENMTDRNAKGRNARGSKTGVARLTEDAVREIRSTYDRNSVELAQRFGVSRATIMNVVNGKSWKHVQ